MNLLIEGMDLIHCNLMTATHFHSPLSLLLTNKTLKMVNTFETLPAKSNTTFKLPTNDEAKSMTYREGTEAGDELERRMTEVKSMKEDVAKGQETTSSNGYTVPVGKKFKLTEYCDAEKMSKREYNYLTRRLSGNRKQPHALSTTRNAANNRRYNNNKAAGKAAAKKVGRKRGF